MEADEHNVSWVWEKSGPWKLNAKFNEEQNHEHNQNEDALGVRFLVGGIIVVLDLLRHWSPDVCALKMRKEY